VRRALIAVACAVLAGCGYVGDPKPPTLDIPSTIADLRAIQYGGKILVEFTLPALTTEGLTLSKVRSIKLRAAGGGAERTFNIPPKDPGAFEYEFDASEWAGKQVTLTVHATGPKGKTSGWSNAVVVAAGPPLGIPRNLKAEDAPRGVRLTWQGDGPAYRIFRSSGELAPAPVGDAMQPEYADGGAENGTAYRYFVLAFDGDTRQSEASTIVEITPRDAFPPAVPADLSATAGVDSIELAWQRNTETDFASYNIYRSTDGGAFEQIAGTVTAPTYSDRALETGKRYRYAVSSVDLVGNESPRSTVAEAVAP